MREGVNKVALRLFEHNEKAYHAAVRMMEQYGKAAIVHPTGTGKSYIAFKLIEDNPEKVVIWLSPSEYIFKTQLESLKRNDPDFPLANVLFYTYAKLMCCTQAQLEKIAAQKPAYIILDEFHRAGAECWGESAVALLKLCSNAKLLGLTATNIRYLDNNRDMAEELFDGHTASDMTLGEAVVRGILPAPKYVTTVYQYQKTLAKYQARVDNLRAPGIQDVNQKYLDALRRALEQADGLDLVFQHHITQTSGKFRDKKAGWGSNFCYSYYDNGDKNKIKIKRFPKEGASHEIHYLRGDISRENCFSCEMSNTNRVSDFTFGDYWAIEIEHPEFIVRKDPALSIRKGINCMMVNTEKGMQYLSKLQEKMVMYEVDLASITRHNSNLLKPSKRGKARDAVLENYYMEGYKKIEENYNDTVGKKRTVYAAKNMIKTHIPDKLRVQIYRMKFLRKLLSGE